MPEEVAIIIAAGGAGKRIGGDKPARLLAGKPLIVHVADWAQARSTHVALAVRENTPELSMDLPRLVDRRADPAPINALEIGFAYAERHGCTHIMLLGCDMPLLPADLLEKLLAAIGDAGAALPQTDKFSHPLAGLWRTNHEALAAYLVAGERALWKFAKVMGAVTVDWPAAETERGFLNINDEAALARAETLLRSGA